MIFRVRSQVPRLNPCRAGLTASSCYVTRSGKDSRTPSGWPIHIIVSSSLLVSPQVGVSHRCEPTPPPSRELTRMVGLGEQRESNGIDPSRIVAVAAGGDLPRARDIHRAELAVSTRPDELETEEFDPAHESLALRDGHADSTFSDWRVDDLHLPALGYV